MSELPDDPIPPWTTDHLMRLRRGESDDPLLHGPGLLAGLTFAKQIARDVGIEHADQLETLRPQLLEHIVDGDYAEAIRRVPWSWIEWLRAHPAAVIPPESHVPPTGT